MSLARTSLGVVAALVVACTTAHAGKYNKVVDVGMKAPAWKDLEGVDGKRHSLADLKKAKVVVVVFTCNTCPVAVAYEKRIVEFARAYKKKGVAVVAINSNRNGGNDIAAMKKRAGKRKFSFPYVTDPKQAVKKLYGAAVTPHFFVLDQQRTIAYMGRFDDSQNEKKVAKRDLPAAVDALLAGEKPPVAETRQFGCGIK